MLKEGCWWEIQAESDIKTQGSNQGQSWLLGNNVMLVISLAKREGNHGLLCV